MSAAGILNAKMGKVFGWVKSHSGKTTKQQQQQQQQQHHQQQQPRSRSQDGLEMRDFPLTQRSLEEVFRGHEEAMDLNNILAGRPLPSLDLLPPFYHDKTQGKLD